MTREDANPENAGPSVTYVDIEDRNDVGQRIDNFLLRHLKGVPRPLIYRILRSGEVRVNGGRVKAAYRLKAQDRLRLPPIRRPDQVQPRLATGLAQRLEAAVLFEDEHFVALDKPTGVAVHGGSNVAAGVVETMRLARRIPRLELVHRLDRNTSGCLLLAKNRRALAEAQEQFRRRRVRKLYDAYVWGPWPARLRVVQKKLKRYTTSWGERRVRVDATGQAARTDFEIVATAPTATHLRVRLHTGRTHQIRVHCQTSGHPVVGDDKYLAPGTEASQNIGRLCLHASKLELPLAQGSIKVVAPCPQEMIDIWHRLGGRASNEGAVRRED